MNNIFSYSRLFVAVGSLVMVFTLIGLRLEMGDLIGYRWMLQFLSATWAVMWGVFTILVIDLVFGTRPFWQRLAELYSWVVGVSLAEFVVLFNYSDMAEVLNFIDFFVMIPTLALAVQVPFWLVAYGTSWQLTAEGSYEGPRSPWSLRDWIVGCAILSVTLAVSRLSSESQDHSTVTYVTGGMTVWALLLPFACMFYVLRIERWRFVLFCLSVHVVLYCVAALMPMLFMLYGNQQTYSWEAMLGSGVHVVGAFSGALTLRAGGYRLTSRRNVPVAD
jgi:hypothetical protein